jgi:hypothetical protein
MRKPVNAVRQFHSDSWQAGKPHNRKRTNIVMLLSNAAQISSWALLGQWINTKEQPDVAM